MPCLHIGVFRDGKLVDERYAAMKGAVTVGRSAKNTIWLAGAQIPEQHTLVTFDRRRASLHLMQGMQGEIALDGRNRKSLTDFDSQSIELQEGTRGRVTIGDTTFFLQDMERPKAPPRSALPKSVRSGFLSGVDRTFTRVFVGVFIAELAAFAFVSTRPHIESNPPLTQDEPDRFVAVAALSKPPPKPVDAPDVAKPGPSKPQAARSPTKLAPSRAGQITNAVSQSPLIAVLGARGGSGALDNVFGAGLGTEIADAFKDTTTIRVATLGDGANHKGRSGPDGPVTIGGIATATGGDHRVRLHDVTEIAPLITVEPDDVVVEGGELDKGKVGRFVQGRLGAIQQCYERELKLLPSLRGKLEVRFTITPDSATGECDVESDNLRDDKVAECVLQRIRAWRYPFKPAQESPVTFPFVFQPGT